MTALQSSVDALTNAPVESILNQIMNYLSRPLSEFNKFEAMEMSEELYLAANDCQHHKDRYYRVVYQAMREKMELAPAYFRALLLRLLGDKDQERVSQTFNNSHTNNNKLVNP